MRKLSISQYNTIRWKYNFSLVWSLRTRKLSAKRLHKAEIIFSYKYLWRFWRVRNSVLSKLNLTSHKYYSRIEKLCRCLPDQQMFLSNFLPSIQRNIQCKWNFGPCLFRSYYLPKFTFYTGIFTLSHRGKLTAQNQHFTNYDNLTVSVYTHHDFQHSFFTFFWRVRIES